MKGHDPGREGRCLHRKLLGSHLLKVQEGAACADVLAGRKTTGKTQGTILFAGVKPSSMFLRRYTGYVEQFGTALPPCGRFMCCKLLCISVEVLSAP